MKFWLILHLISFQVWALIPLDEKSGDEISFPGINDNIPVESNLLFEACQLTGKLDYKVFERAMKGYFQLENKKQSYLTIIDYTKPSTEKRLFIIDIKNQKLVYNTLVAHGKNSGLNFASSFSNKKMSLQSSPGFYLTGETYHGKHGYSLRLDGIEKGINDNARARAIVLHGAGYVNPEFIQKYQRLGRSWGCPAVPDELSEEIIDLIKGGSCLYIHTEDPQYFQNSVLLNNI